MSQADLLNDLLNSNPNEPATKGVILLLRAEMKSEFKSVRTDLGGRMDGLETRMVGLETRMVGLETRIVGLDTRMDGLETRLERLEAKVDKIDSSLDLVARNVAILVARA